MNFSGPIRKQLQPGQHKAKLRVCGDYSVMVNPQLESQIPHAVTRRHDEKVWCKPLLQQDRSGRCLPSDQIFTWEPEISPEHSQRSSTSNQDPLWNYISTGLFPRNNGQTDGWSGRHLISGAKATEHLSNLKSLLKWLQDNGLRCNLSKCRFAEPTVEYLGHTLSKDGIKMGRQVDAVAKMPAPTSVSTLKSFIGSVQFYSKFIPNLSTISEPLTRLTRTKTDWQRTSREESSFQGLKKLLYY